MVPLYYTVLVYLLPAAYASYHNMWLGPSLFALIPFAVLNHFPNKEANVGALIKCIDRTFTHIIALKTVIDATFSPTTTFSLSLYYLCLIYTIGAFYFWKPSTGAPSSAHKVHASMHLVSAIGLCAYVHAMH